MDVEWAIATRVQGDKDVMIVSNARAKPLDPSLPQGFGVVPTGAKVGIDATIPDGIPKEHYERITYAYADKAKIDDYVKGKADEEGEAGDEIAVAQLAGKILQTIEKEPLYYTDVAERFSTYDFRTVAGGRAAERAASGLGVVLLPARLRIARRDGVDADAVRADFLRQRLAEYDDGGFCRRIDRGAGAALEPAARRDADDGAAPGLG